MPVVDSSLARGATRYTILELVLIVVFWILPFGNCWNYGAGYWMGSTSMEMMFDYLGLTDGFAQQVIGYLKVYSGGVQKMFDYLRLSNEAGS